jgi:hypothetical protein
MNDEDQAVFVEAMQPVMAAITRARMAGIGNANVNLNRRPRSFEWRGRAVGLGALRCTASRPASS